MATQIIWQDYQGNQIPIGHVHLTPVRMEGGEIIVYDGSSLVQFRAVPDWHARPVVGDAYGVSIYIGRWKETAPGVEVDTTVRWFPVVEGTQLAIENIISYSWWPWLRDQNRIVAPDGSSYSRYFIQEIDESTTPFQIMRTWE
jgi:hypothetical protein